jgi:uncharacterized protein
VESIKTPCIGICEIDIGSRLCRGCRRSESEIGAWSAMSDEDRETLMDLLLFRSLEDGTNEKGS